MKKLFILFLLLPTVATAQTTSWTLSPNANSYASINPTTGQIKLNTLPNSQIIAIVTATTTQDGKVKSNIKQVVIDPICSASIVVGQCCMFNNLQYCAISAGGYTWLDRNLGATTVGQQGSLYAWGTNSPNGVYVSGDNAWNTASSYNNPCPSGWRVAYTMVNASLLSAPIAERSAWCCANNWTTYDLFFWQNLTSNGYYWSGDCGGWSSYGVAGVYIYGSCDGGGWKGRLSNSITRKLPVRCMK